MKVTLVPCGPAVNESERKAFEQLKTRLISAPGPEWRDNDFVALMAWVEGEPLSEFAGLFPILAEDFQEAMAPMVDGAVRVRALVCGALKRAFAQVA